MDRCRELTRCFKSKVRVFGLNTSVIAEGLDVVREVNESACLADWKDEERLKVLQEVLAIVKTTFKFCNAQSAAAALACLQNNVACLQLESASDLGQVDSLFSYENAPVATRTILLINRACFILHWLCLDASPRSQAFAVGAALEHATASCHILEKIRAKGTFLV